MDGWTDGQMNGLMHTEIDRWMDGWMYRRIDRSMYRRMYGLLIVWMGG